MSTDGGKSEYKGAMRLPVDLHARLMELSKLTHRSLNDLIVEAADFLETLAASGGTETFPVPDAVVTARALREHRKKPTIINLAERYAAMLPPERQLRAAEEPLPKHAQARRAAEK